MSPIDSFNAAFNIFLNTGRFEISDSALSLKQLQTLHSHLKKYPIPVGRTVPFYEIHLNNVEFIPFHIEELIEQKGPEGTVLSGDLTEQGLPLFLPALPEVTKSFNVTNATAQLSIAFWFLGASAFQIVLGPLSDHYGRKKILLQVLRLPL